MTLDISAVFESAATAYMLIDRDLRYVWVNRAYCEVTGRKPEQLVGQYLPDVFPAEGEAQAMLHASFERVFQNGRTDHLPFIPYPIAKAGGEIEHRYWSATHTPIPGDDGRVQYLLQNTHDVTDLYMRAHQAEAEVAKRADLDEGEVGEGAEEGDRGTLHLPAGVQL